MMVDINIGSMIPLNTNGAEVYGPSRAGGDNKSDQLFILGAAANKLERILGTTENIKNGADRNVELGKLRSAIETYANANGIDPFYTKAVLSGFKIEFDKDEGIATIPGKVGELPTLDQSSRNPNEKVNSEFQVRSALNQLMSYRELPANDHLISQASPQRSGDSNTDSILQNARSTLQMLNEFVNRLSNGSSANGAKSTNNVGTLQNARNVVGDIRLILGTDAEIAATGKKNAALAKLDSAIDAWAKANNIPAGVVALVKAEAARDIGTYNGKLITADDEANKLALQKFPEDRFMGVGNDRNAGNRAAYAKEIKAELQSQNSAVLSELNSLQSSNRARSPYQHTMTDAYGNTSNGPNYNTGTATSPLNRTLNAATNLANILGTSSEIAATGNKTEPLAKLNKAIDEWGKANNIPATTIALAKSRIATEYGLPDSKLPTVDDEAKRVAFEKFPPATGFAAILFGDPNNKARSDFEANYKKDVSQQVQAAVNELNYRDDSEIDPGYLEGFDNDVEIEEQNETPVDQDKIDNLVNPEANNNNAA
jgi:hypothetical protein